MLILSLILSGLLLLVVNLIARNSQHAGGPIVVVCLGFFLGPPFFLWCVFPPVALQSLLLCGAATVWRAGGRGPSWFTRLSLGSTVVAYGLSGLLVLQSEREYARLRDVYPMKSMDGRLAPMRPSASKSALALASLERLDRLEQDVDQGQSGYREFELRQLHEHAVALFLNSPGFGTGRMIRPNGWSLAGGLRREPLPLEPGSRTPPMWSPGNGEGTPAGMESPLGKILEASILDFVNPRGFGYIKDRRHVAGFESHRFSRVPEPAECWRVQTVELVSLLLHDEPAVYVSDHLPRMEPHPHLPTRPLDRFERFGLVFVRAGEDLFIAAASEGVQMVGAVRSTGQCMVCHDCRRGDLLGAFSYTLKKHEIGNPKQIQNSQ